MAPTLVALISALVAAAALVALAVTVARSRRARRRLRLHDPWLTELFTRSDDPAALLGPTGQIVRVNPAFRELFGHEPGGNGASRGLRELFVTWDDGLDAADVEARVLGGEPVRGPARARTRDGGVLDVDVVGGPARIPGDPARAFLIVRDRTRRLLVDAAFRRLEKAVDTMQLGVTVTDLEGRIVYTNPADAAMHGYEAEEVVGRDVRIYAPRHTHDPLPAREVASLGTWRRESVNVRKDGTTFPVQLMSDVVRDAKGQPIGVVTTCEDISQRKEAEEALRESEERYALALRGANHGIWDWEPGTGRVFYSSVWKRIIGYEARDLPETLDAWMERVHPDDAVQVRADLDDHRQGRTEDFESEHRLRHRDGSFRWVLARGRAEWGDDGEVRRITGSLSDITERKRAEAQLAQGALYDHLTGLPNRAFLDDLMQRAARRSRRRRGDYIYAVLFLDLDRFKQVNDALGHAVGDRLLVEVGRRLQSVLRPGDVVARMGGDEFCILLDDIGDQGDAIRVARRVLKVLAEPIRVDGHAVLTGASVGIAVDEDGDGDPEHLMRNADTAMYRAKAAGRGRFVLFDRSMHERALALLRLESELRNAMEAGELRLVYQPVVRLADHEIVGLEALLRWDHPERGEIPPAAFLPAAEQSGFIVPMGWWVLEEACRQMGEWSDRVPGMDELSVSVNLSARQLRQPDLVDRVRHALANGGLAPDRLRLEVSERALMEEPEWHRDVLARLRELGVRVQLDDFGTGSSSLAWLQGFHVSTLKIDSSLVQSGEAPADRRAVVQAVITLARHLGIRVVAEGVETDGQDAWLESVDCDHGQGFLYHRPLEPEAVAALLRDRSEAMGGV